MIGLLTAVYDSYDTLKPFAPQDVAVDAVCVTDDPALTCEGWRIVYEPRPGMHPNRAAKVAKMCPWHYSTGEQSVWIDASFRITSERFVREVLDYAEPIAQFVHWERDCIYDEAGVSIAIPKYFGQPLAQQAREYETRGHPAHWGLWATGVIARQHSDPVVTLCHQWLVECNEWTYQDQVSQPVVLRAMGMRPDTIPGTYYVNPWINYEGSGRH